MTEKDVAPHRPSTSRTLPSDKRVLLVPRNARCISTGSTRQRIALDEPIANFVTKKCAIQLRSTLFAEVLKCPLGNESIYDLQFSFDDPFPDLPYVGAKEFCSAAPRVAVAISAKFLRNSFDCLGRYSTCCDSIVPQCD